MRYQEDCGQVDPPAASAVTGVAVPAKPMQSQRQLAHRRNAPVICATDGVESLVALFRPPAPIEKRATS